MSTLAVLIPPRPRLHAAEASAPTPPSGEVHYVHSDDGLGVGRAGRTSIALLPKADQVVAVLDAADVSWHRIVCPRAPAARLGAALVGVLEDAVLDDATLLHFALEPGAQGGASAWVAATDRAWLGAEIARLEASGRRVDRVVPAAWPQTPARAHFHAPDDATLGDAAGDPGGALRLDWAHADGVASVPLQGGLARALLPQPLPDEVRCSATPAAAASAEQWLGRSVRVLGSAEHALQAARSPWNLRQFGLAPQHRGLSALGDLLHRLRQPAWRPLRWGLVGLAVVQLAGLNLAAWQQRSTLDAKRAAMTTLLQSAHPQVRAVLDAPVQMQRETDALRAAAGRPGEGDLEAALQAAAGAWPPDQPVQTLGYQAGRLTLAAPGWSEAQLDDFSRAVEASGWAVERADGRVTLGRAGAGARI